MAAAASTAPPPDPALSRPRLCVVAAIGMAQILAWGSSYYLPAVLAAPETRATGWGETWIIGALSLGLLVSGLVSPQVGYLIERFGGRPVLAASALLLAAGLVIQALALNLPMFVLAWLVLGLGMGAGLYDPAFATLGRLYGDEARSAITQVTLFAGFSSTLCWPLSAFLVETVGWRGASLGYAVINIAVVLPLYLLGVPREARHPAPAGHAVGTAAQGERGRPGDRPAFLILAAGLTVASVIMTVVSVHLLTLLQARGLALAAAVGLGALMGPSQVGARALEALFGRKFHPIWSLVVSTVLVAVGLAMMLGPARAIGAGVVLYGAGGGIRSIARGTVPLAMFGREGYAILMGWLAMPSLLAQAASPSIGVVLIERLGPSLTLAVLCATAVLNIGLVLCLLPFALRRPMVA
jgi:predicted MFS family arabinose efflux permease